jgi:hypothetical protein
LSGYRGEDARLILVQPTAAAAGAEAADTKVRMLVVLLGQAREVILPAATVRVAIQLPALVTLSRRGVTATTATRFALTRGAA